MRHPVLKAFLALALLGCDGGTGNADCVAMSGSWSLGFSCHSKSDGGGGGGSSGGYQAEVTQAACTVTLTQKDDNTTQTWISTGTVDKQGNLSLTGQFGFVGAGTTCTAQITGDTWTGTCESDSEACELNGQRLTR